MFFLGSKKIDCSSPSIKTESIQRYIVDKDDMYLFRELWACNVATLVLGLSEIYYHIVIVHLSDLFRHLN